MQTENRPSIIAQWQWQRNYHYLRYGILAFYLVALGALPHWLQSEFLSLRTVGISGICLTILCWIMDIRNYLLFREEEKFIRDNLGRPKYSPPLVTVFLFLFYFGSLIIFVRLISQIGEKQVILTIEGVERLGQTSLVTHKKMLHLPSGWTKVRGSDGIEYLLKNEEIKEVKQTKKEE